MVIEGKKPSELDTTSINDLRVALRCSNHVLLTSYGFESIDSYVTGYTYKKRAISTTTPELIANVYYVSRLEIGTTTFANFLNDGVPYAITVAAVTFVALKYNGSAWSHTVLPSVDGADCVGLFLDKHIIIPNGTYLINGSVFYQALSVSGYSRNTCHLMNVGSELLIYWSVYRNITFYNFRFSDYYIPSPLEIYDSKVIAEAEIDDSGVGYTINLGLNNRTVYYNHKFVNVEFEFAHIYTCIWGDMINHIDIIGCKFTGTSVSHPIRINNCLQGAEIAYNYVEGGKTGIFFGSQRVHPIENINVHNNEVCYQTEEGISFDGFGNNWDLCPVICNGLVTAVSNDADGKLVIVADLKERDGTSEIDSLISGRTTWTDYYFAFSDGSGLEGLVCKIDDYSAEDDSLTLNCFESADNVSIGGLVGVHCGFFNCQVKDNILHHIYNDEFVYGTALSIYLNVFGFVISGNKVYGCYYGIDLAAGRMLTTYYTLAYNNTIENNIFYNSKIFIPVNYTTDHKMFGNKFINNNVYGTELIIYQQDKFQFEGNILDRCTSDFKRMQDTLPTASVNYIGRSFLLFVNDANGVPTDIKEYRCKLVTGEYTWVEIA